MDEDDNLQSYDVLYVDGDRERGVKVNLTRPFVPFKVGDEVEARFGGKKRWFPGRVADADEEKACYKILYEDGDSEDNVIHRFVRVPKVKA